MNGMLTGDGNFEFNLILPCYSQIAKNILWATVSNMRPGISRMNFKWMFYPDFIYEVAPDGSIVLPNVNAEDKPKETKYLANQIKKMLKESSVLWKPVYDESGALAPTIDESVLKAVDTDTEDISNDTEVMTVCEPSPIRSLNIYKNCFIIDRNFYNAKQDRVKTQMTFTVKQAWILHFYLSGNEQKLQQFSAEEIAEVVGSPRDPFEIERLGIFMENCRKVFSECEEYYKAVKAQETTEINKIRDKYENRLKKRQDKAFKNVDKIAKKMKIF